LNERQPLPFFHENSSIFNEYSTTFSTEMGLRDLRFVVLWTYAEVFAKGTSKSSFS
jgi:hypothetical protein